MSCYLSEAQIATDLKRFHSSPRPNTSSTRRDRICESLDRASFFLIERTFYYHPSLLAKAPSTTASSSSTVIAASEQPEHVTLADTPAFADPVREVADDVASNRDLEDAFRAGVIDRPTYEAMLRLRADDDLPDPVSRKDAAVSEDRTELCQQLRQENEESTALSHRFSRACDVCLTEVPRQRVCFTGCGHAVCRACAEELAAEADARRRPLACPDCRTESGFVRLFERRSD